MKAASYLWDSISQPKEGIPGVALCHAFNSPDDLWGFYAKKENEYRHARFGQAMIGTLALQPPSHILEGKRLQCL